MSSTAQLTESPIVIRQPRRWAFAAGLINPALPILTTIIYFTVLPSVWVALIPFVWFYVGIPVLDALVGEDLTNPPEEDFEKIEADPFYMGVMLALIPIIAVGFFSTMALMVLGGLPWWSMPFVIYAAGVGGGGQAIVLAHELGHRREKAPQNWAKVALGIVGYGHFCVEHNRGHHVNVATPEDCSSSRMNESVYAFARRDLIGAFAGAWAHEMKRLRNKKMPVFSQHNVILQSYAITVVLAAVAVAWLGWSVLPWIIIHHFFAYFALTMVNYIEHYGLKREKLANGRYEPCQPKHSWNTNHTVSNAIVINLQRHSDHHANPARPYQCLRNFEEIPRLPSGYPGCITMALFPPLWFKVMNPKVREWAGGDDSKLNWGPSEQ